MEVDEATEVVALKKLEKDIERYQSDVSINNATSSQEGAKNAIIDGTVDAIVTPLTSGKVKLLEFIQALGPTMMQKDPLVRSKSVRLLSLTLGRLAIDSCLLDSEIEHLFDFLLARLEDHHLVAPAALLGLRALSHSTRLPEMAPEKLLRSIFDQLNVQTLAQVDRFSVYIIIRNLMANHLHRVKTSLGPNFVHGFIQTMDGEKDPRNLVVCFELSAKISQTFSLGAFVEDMFEVVACYFPIDFNPPKNDPFGITKTLLVDGLSRAMTASPAFAPYCLPLIIEKLSSDMASSKLESLRTLKACTSVFGAKGLRDHLELLTGDLRREMFTSMSDATQKAVEDAATAITIAISAEDAISEYPELLPHFAALILKECGNYLNEPQHRLMYAASRLLLAFCKGSLYVTIRVIQASFPFLHKHFMKSPQLNSRCPIVEVIGSFLSVLCDHVRPIESEESGSNKIPAKSPIKCGTSEIAIEEVPLKTGAPVEASAKSPSHHRSVPFFGFDEEAGELADLRHPVLEVLDACLSSPDERLCQLGVATAESVLRLPNALQNDEQIKDVIFRVVCLAIFHASPTSRATAVMAVGRLRFRSHGESDEENLFDEMVLPILVNHLAEAITNLSNPEDVIAVDEAGDRNSACHANVENLGVLISSTCVTTQSFSTAMDKLLTASETQGVGTRIGRVLLRCINVLADKGMEIDNNNKDVLKNKVLPRVKSILIDDWDSAGWLHDDEVVAQGAALARKVVGLMNDAEANAEWEETKGSLVNEILNDSSSSSKSLLFPLLLAVGASVPRGCGIHKCREFMKTLLDLAASPQTKNSLLQLDACKLFGAIVNKIENEAELTVVLDQVAAFLDTTPDRNAKLLWIWVTKALVLRSHRNSKMFTQRLVSWLTAEDAEAAAFVSSEAFSTVLADDEKVMTPPQHAILRKMNKQRFFLQTIPILIEPNREEDSSTRFRINAVASMLPHLPHQVLISELPTIFPILVKALSCDDRTLQESVVKSLLLLLKESPSSLSPHADAVIPKLITLAQTSASMEVRCSALECLRVMIGSPSASPEESNGFAPSLLMPHKPTVVRELAKCLDDKKRLVRRQAVLTRNKWYLI